MTQHITLQPAKRVFVALFNEKSGLVFTITAEKSEAIYIVQAKQVKFNCNNYLTLCSKYQSTETHPVLYCIWVDPEYS